MEATPFVLSAAQPPAADLIFSVLAGVAQLVLGAVLVARGIRRPRVRQFAVYALALLGVWLIASGVAECCVSGLLLSARLSREPGQGPVAIIRPIADTTLFVITGVLLGLLALYPFRRRHDAASERDEPG